MNDYTLDFNERLGFDATSTESIDTPDESYPYFNPHYIDKDNGIWKIDLMIPEVYLGENANK